MTEAWTWKRRLFAAAALALAAPVAAQDLRCPYAADPRGFAAPAPRGQIDLVYSDAADLIRIGPGPSILRHDAAGGEDTIYLVDPPSGLMLAGGPGADIIVVCTMPDLSFYVSLSDPEAWDAADTAPDTLVIEPEVFLGLPPGVERQIEVQGFNPVNDRIRLRVPPGVQTVFQPSPYITLRAGNVAIHVTPSGQLEPPGPEIFQVESAAPTADVPVRALAPPLAGYDPALTCDRASNLAPAAPVRQSDDFAVHPPAAGPFRIDPLAGAAMHLTGDGPDAVLSFVAGSIAAGVGPDQIVICAMDGSDLTVAAGPGGPGALDVDPDTVVIEAGRLQDGPERRINVVNLTPLNDRVVLRVPEGLEPQILTSEAGWAYAKVGRLRVDLLAQDWSRGLQTGPEIFLMERVAAPAALPATPQAQAPVSAEPQPLAHAGRRVCDRIPAPGSWPAGVAATSWPGTISYTTGPEDIRMSWPAGADRVDFSAGDDLVELFDPLPGASVALGDGADVLVLCAMQALALSIELGDAVTQADGDTDLVVLASPLFSGVPAGLDRRLEIHGFNVETDQIVLRVPPGVEALRLATDPTSVYRVGPVRLYVGHDGGLDRDLVAEGRLVVTTDAAATVTPAPALAPPLAGTGLDCADDHTGATPTRFERDFVPVAVFAPTDDFIRVARGSEALTWSALEGDDRVLIHDPPESARIELGPGADGALFCSMSEIGAIVDLGPHDAEPDLLVIGPEVFLDVPAGFKRQITVWGVVPANDRIVLRLPPGLAAVPTRSEADVTGLAVGDAEIKVFATGRVDGSIFVVEPGGG